MITLGLGLAFLTGLVGSSALHIMLEHPSPRVRRMFFAGFPTTLAIGCAGLSGLIALCAPGVDPQIAALVAAVIGYLLYRVVDQAMNGRPHVFSADEVVLVPADWH